MRSAYYPRLSHARLPLGGTGRSSCCVRLICIDEYDDDDDDVDVDVEEDDATAATLS